MSDEIEIDHDVFNNAAEQCVLGGMLLSAQTIGDVTDILTGADFHRPHHETIFEAILDLYERGQPVDPITVSELLTKNGDLQQVGGLPYLHVLINSVPSASTAASYAEIVLGYAELRELRATGVQIVSMANPTTDRDDIAEIYHVAIGKLQTRLNAVRRATVPTAGDLFADTLDGIEKPAPLRNVPTGITDLDDILGGGLHPGQLALVAARPSVGKSVAGLGFARYAAIKHGIPTLLVTCEMSADDVMRRLISAEATVNLHHLQTGELDERDWGLIARIAEKVTAAPLHIDFTPGISAAQLRSTIRNLHRSTTGLGLVIVDYLQLMTPPKAENREQRIAALARELKYMSQEFNVPVVALAQLNRESEKRVDKVPTSSDLRESGALEQEADVIVLLHRPDMYEDDSPRAGECDVIVSKNRSGPKRTIATVFQGHYARLASMSSESEPWTPHAALRDVA